MKHQKSRREACFFTGLIVSAAVASVVMMAGCSRLAEKTVMCVQVDPLEKVFTEQMYFVETPDTAAVAKGETATFQFVVRSAYPIEGLKIEAGYLENGDRQIEATLKAFVGYIRAGVHAGDLGAAKSKDAVYPVSDLYPDCLQETESIDVASMQNQPVWVSYAIPRDAEDGKYTANLVFSGKANGKRFRIAKEVNARVYPVVLPEQTLWVTNWFESKGFRLMNRNQPVEYYSDRYWELLASMANVMRDHGQNTYWFWHSFETPTIENLFNIQCTGTQYAFDFTNFDKMVELLQREGGLKRIESGHLGYSTGSGIGIYVPKEGLKPIDDEKAHNFLSQFLPAMYSHLESKGWTGMYVQHICDEPSAPGEDEYVRIAELVKKYMPGIPIMDAINVHSTKLENCVDIWVAIPNHRHEFYQERQAAGNEFWHYTCCSPQGNYANRFLELPLIQTRFLHWINYRYGTTGYLHWGFNWWDRNITDDSAFGFESWPAGDSWIVYPKEGGVYGSIRLAAMRDGINDYELLKLLERKAPDTAKYLVGRVIKGFDSYNSNIRAFRLTRLALLKALSE